MYIEISEKKKWKRSVDGYIAGVCEGMGSSFDINPNVIRLVWLGTVLLFGTGIFLYFLAALILPREDRMSDYHEDKILGVCHRISEKSEIELPIIRFIAVISALSSLGLTILIYLLLHFLMDKPNDKVML